MKKTRRQQNKNHSRFFRSLLKFPICVDIKKKKKMSAPPPPHRVDTASDAAIAAALAQVEAEHACERQLKKSASGKGNIAPGSATVVVGNADNVDEAAAAALAMKNNNSNSNNTSIEIASKRTFSCDDTSNDEALAWALHEAQLPSNKGPSAFARAASLQQNKQSSSSSSPPPSPPSAAAAAAAAPTVPDWRLLLERAASERIAAAGARLAPFVPRPLPAAAPPWPWSGVASALGFGGSGSGPAADRERARLSATLEAHGLAERTVRGDGACQFRALSDQLYGSEDYHEAVRGLAVQVLAAHPERYSPFICGSGSGSGNGSSNGNGNGGSDENVFTSYVARMSSPREWGDHVTLQAAADGLGLRVVVVSSFEREPFIEIEPAERRSGRILFVSFWAEIHYNSVYVAPPKNFSYAFPVVTTESNGNANNVTATTVATTTTTTAAAVAEDSNHHQQQTTTPPRSGASTPERMKKVKEWFRERLS